MKNKKAEIFFFGLLIILLLLILLENKKPSMVSSVQNAGNQIPLAAKQAAKNAKYVELINKHLLETQRKMDFSDYKNLAEQQKLFKDMGKVSAQSGFEGPGSLQPEEGVELQQTSSERLLEDLGQNNRQRESVSPVDQIRDQLYQDEQTKLDIEQQRKEYIRLLVANAKKAGWQIQVDNQGKVISAKPMQGAY